MLVVTLLTSCVGPTLFTIGGYNITLGSVVTIPIKKKVVEELKEREYNEESIREDTKETSETRGSSR
jgi:hypothetical protein